MGLKQWLARITARPSEFARSYTSGLIGLIEHLAASLLAFSGRRMAASARESQKVAFENHFEMEVHGFDPTTKDIAALAAPSLNDPVINADAYLVRRTLLATTAFLYLCSENSARRYMRPENAAEFSKALFSSVAQQCAERFGVERIPRRFAGIIRELLPLFVCEKLLNRDCFAENDGLGLLLNHLCLSKDGHMRYGFVVGSSRQSLGCATAFVAVLAQIEDSLKRCAADLRW